MKKASIARLYYYKYDVTDKSENGFYLRCIPAEGTDSCYNCVFSDKNNRKCTNYNFLNCFTRKGIGCYFTKSML